MRHYKATMFQFLTTYLLALITLPTFAQSADTFKISGIVISTNSDNPISEGTIKFARNKGYDDKDTIVAIVEKDIIDFKLAVFTNCYSFLQLNREIALEDISESKPTLLLVGGIAPIVYSTDKKFSKKYNI